MSLNEYTSWFSNLFFHLKTHDYFHISSEKKILEVPEQTTRREKARRSQTQRGKREIRAAVGDPFTPVIVHRPSTPPIPVLSLHSSPPVANTTELFLSNK